MIPSLELEEKRKAFVPPEADYTTKIGLCGTMVSRKKRKKLFTSKQSADYDRAELLLYEEVTLMKAFRRKTLVLVGASGVGRRTLKTRLLQFDPDQFASRISQCLKFKDIKSMDGYMDLIRGSWISKTFSIRAAKRHSR